MRRAAAVALSIVAFTAVAFGVGWVVSGSEERTVASAPRAVGFKPLPVPEVVILNGPWANPLPKPVRTISHLTRDAADSIVAQIYRVLGVEVPPLEFMLNRP